MPEIWFPNLGIEIAHLDRTAFTLFGRSVYWYGIFIGLAVVVQRVAHCKQPFCEPTERLSVEEIAPAPQPDDQWGGVYSGTPNVFIRIALESGRFYTADHTAAA